MIEGKPQQLHAAAAPLASVSVTPRSNSDRVMQGPFPVTV